MLMRPNMRLLDTTVSSSKDTAQIFRRPQKHPTNFMLLVNLLLIIRALIKDMVLMRCQNILIIWYLTLWIILETDII